MSKKPKLRILAPTPQALKLAKKIDDSGELDTTIWQRPGSLTDSIKTSVEESIPTLAICSLGIIARTLNICKLPSKNATAPLICATEDGGAFVPVLGGHRGANALAQQFAAITQGQAIITTVSDQRFGLALDAPPQGWRLDLQDDSFSTFMQALIESGESGEADLSTAPLWVCQSSICHRPDAPLSIHALYGEPKGQAGRSNDRQLLFYASRHVALGLGCERGCPAAYIEELIARAEEGLGFIFPRPLPAASIDLKADEAAFNALAPAMRFFPAEYLNTFEVPTPSKVVFAEVGTHSVAEASALALAGKGGQLILPKIKNSKATLAVAAALNPIV